MPDLAGPEIEQLKEFYGVLEIGMRAPAWAIKRQYRRLAKRWHPDLFANRPAELDAASERMSQLNQAYQRIKDAPLRNYSPTGAAGRPSPTPSSPSGVRVQVDLSGFTVERDADVVMSGCLAFFACFLFTIWFTVLGRGQWLAVAFYGLAFLVVVSLLRLRNTIWDRLVERLWPR